MNAITEDLTTYPTATIERLIVRWQNVQKQWGPDSHDGKWASQELRPLFAEMARRQKAGLI
jgi:hypothetical protein